MRRAFPFAAVAVIAAFGAYGAAMIEVPLTYDDGKPHDITYEGFSPGGGKSLGVLTAPPPGSWQLPAPIGRHPLYIPIILGDGPRVIMVDSTVDGGEEYSRAYFDANGDGKYDDDPPLELKLISSEEMKRFRVDFVDATVTVDGEPFQYCFSFTLQAFPAAFRAEHQIFAQPQVGDVYYQGFIEPKCSYRGSLRIDDKAYGVLLWDNNANGRFDETFKAISRPQDKDELVRGGCDGLVLMPVGVRRTYDDVLKMTDCLLLNGQLYDLKVSLKERKLTLTPTADSLVSLAFASAPERILLEPKGEGKSLMLLNPGRKAKVPAGEYRAIEYKLHKKDGKGGEWMLRARATKEGAFVEAGGAPLVIGEPFLSSVDIKEEGLEAFRNGACQELKLGLRIEGAGHERVVDFRRMRGAETDVELSPTKAEMPKEPQYRIVKQDGEVVAQGQFEYG